MSEKDPDGIDSSSDDVEYHTYPYSSGDTEKEDGNQQRASESRGDSSMEDAAIVAEPQTQTRSGQMDNSGRYEEKKVFSEDLYTGQAPPVKKKSRKWQYIAIVGVLLLIIGSSFALMHQALSGELYTSNDKVAVIYVQGTLLTSSIPGGLGYATSEDISANIRKATNDKAVKAIVLRINSPGGSSTAGEEIYTEVKRASESGIPVVVSMGDVAASAAYHLSAPADLIIANPSTMTGSIGTIWTFQNNSGYYDQEGVEIYVAKSGEFKDMGGSWRGLSDDEKEYANEVVLEVYGHFIQDVADSRRMSLEDVKDLADGRIYTGQKAKELGLVDELGNLYYAINRASELGGIQGEPVVVYMNKPTLSSLLFGSGSDTSAVDQFLHYYDESPYGQIT
ncbi:MAG: signal peptide peptidase SppA [Methanolobus sp.]|uniref:signal peptide peptidase SppA n=1 Tax=Methanolobus sp. TaxID=1874737 RepID=UPI00272F721C|nr:signal peptide peptidase SppA [Methanolobus sp.]MDP2218428.1 signal peptide peptidase SppA [Methanolobus sp.]